VFMGRRGWHGKVVRRVRPPGALEGPAAASAAPGGGFAQRPWQAEPGPACGAHCQLADAAARAASRGCGDEVMEVLATRSRRRCLN